MAWPIHIGSQPQGCSESPQLALQPLWIDGKCKKWVLSPLGPRLHPCEHQRTPKRRAQGPPGAGPCRGDPKGPVWPPGATGVHVLARGAPRRGGCPCMTAHMATFGRQVHNVNYRDLPPGASRSFGASIGPLGTQRVDLGRRWPKTFLLCPRSDNFFKNGTVR